MACGQICPLPVFINNYNRLCIVYGFQASMVALRSCDLYGSQNLKCSPPQPLQKNLPTCPGSAATSLAAAFHFAELWGGPHRSFLGNARRPRHPKAPPGFLPNYSEYRPKRDCKPLEGSTGLARLLKYSESKHVTWSIKCGPNLSGVCL